MYNLASASKRAIDEPSPHVHARRHGHQHVHAERKAKRDMVVATIDGQVVSWENNWFGPGGAPAPTDAPKPDVAAPPAAEPTGDSAPAPKPKAETKPKPKVQGGAAGDWHRIAYYNAEEQVADNIVFLGNYGGDGSGVFDTSVNHHYITSHQKEG